MDCHSKGALDFAIEPHDIGGRQLCKRSKELQSGGWFQISGRMAGEIA
jgi:hypothetical protein